MTVKQHNANQSDLKGLVAEDRDLMKTLMKQALHEVLETEMTELLGAGPHEREAGRQGYRAGHDERGLVTRIGKLELRVPRDRNGQFQTALFERTQRSEKAFVAALAERYVQGVFTCCRRAYACRPRRLVHGLGLSAQRSLSLLLPGQGMCWQREPGDPLCSGSDIYPVCLGNKCYGHTGFPPPDPLGHRVGRHADRRAGAGCPVGNTEAVSVRSQDWLDRAGECVCSHNK